jgi:hypothetical protein
MHRPHIVRTWHAMRADSKGIHIMKNVLFAAGAALVVATAAFAASADQFTPPNSGASGAVIRVDDNRYYGNNGYNNGYNNRYYDNGYGHRERPRYYRERRYYYQPAPNYYYPPPPVYYYPQPEPSFSFGLTLPIH